MVYKHIIKSFDWKDTKSANKFLNKMWHKKKNVWQLDAGNDSFIFLAGKIKPTQKELVKYEFPSGVSDLSIVKDNIEEY
jgi:hypothetical protein